MERPPALASDLVQEFVRVAHSDLSRVTELLAQEPALINAAWDWGGGDWETALGSAAHMGRADIARFLLGQGAHLNLFAAAMLGDLSVVQAILAAYPAALQVRGPHGIPLIAHAKAGGPSAEPVLAYLESLQ